MKFKNLLISLLILTTMSSENDVYYSSNLCELYSFRGFNGVPQSNFMIKKFDKLNDKGFMISAIINGNLESASVSPSFEFIENGEIIA